MLRFFFAFAVSLSLLSASESPSESLWNNYYQNTLNETNPDKPLLLAYRYFESEGKSGGTAADLGAGTGRDTLFLMAKGWRVTAIDAELLSIEIILNRAKGKEGVLQVMVSSFSEMELPYELDLINASYALPFCNPKDFPECWQKITDHLAVGGRFSGQLFGDKDEWSSDETRTFHTREQLESLFKEHFQIEYLQIEEGLMPLASGYMKRWHVYHIVAKKIK